MIFELNLTQEGLLFLIASSIILVIGCTLLVQYWHRKLRYLLLMALEILSVGLFSLFDGIGVVLPSPLFIVLRNYVIIPLALFIIILLDSMTRDSTDPVKLAITVGLSAALLIYNSDLTTVVPFYYSNGDASFMNAGVELQAVKFTLLIWIAIVAIFAFGRVATHSPKRFRKYIYLSLFGVMCIGPLGIMVVFTIDLVVPGAMAIVQLIGTITFALGISLKSNSAFVLPFRAITLTVLNTESGVPLFNHTWTGDVIMKDSILFSGIIQGISGILKESVSEGEVEEIKLSNAVLILQRAKDAKIACILASTKTSKLLRRALRLFLQRFLETYAKELKDPSNISQFDSATKLVTQTFPFIPAYE